jgi:hypothetical protein
MKNKAVIINVLEISYAGELCFGEIIDSGIVLKPSDKSNVMIWFPINEIIKIVLPDATEVVGDDVYNIFSILNDFSARYGLDDKLI